MKIFIANFPFDLTEEDICDLFKIFGEVVACKMVKDPDSGKSKGYGFVEFRDAERAKLAMKEMDGVRVSGRNVAVKASTSGATSDHRAKKSNFKKSA
jgi:RNA recognition motif-containing protein